MGDAPSAYADKLRQDAMSIDGVVNSGRMSLTERFDRIQGARARSRSANGHRVNEPAGKTLRVAPARPRNNANSRR